jgi:hypothetical protein
MTPPDQPDLGDEECSVDGCPWTVLLEQELCEEHDRERAEEDRAERAIDMAQDDGREYPRYYDGTGKW